MFSTTSPTLRVLGDRVLVLPLEDEKETSDSGYIFLPQSARKKGQVAKVISVGPKCVTRVQEGDTVIMACFRGNEIELAGVVYELLRESDIFGVLE